jgi:hypothetical protein
MRAFLLGLPTPAPLNGARPETGQRWG